MLPPLSFNINRPLQNKIVSFGMSPEEELIKIITITDKYSRGIITENETVKSKATERLARQTIKALWHMVEVSQTKTINNAHLQELWIRARENLINLKITLGMSVSDTSKN